MDRTSGSYSAGLCNRAAFSAMSVSKSVTTFIMIGTNYSFWVCHIYTFGGLPIVTKGIYFTSSYLDSIAKQE